MQDAYAVRFRPPNHGRHVPACAYVEVLGFILEGLSSLRFAALARIANETGQPKDLVREALEFKIGPSIPGSLVVPIEAGAQDSLILGGNNVSNLFWRLAREALNSAATGTPSIEFSASGAEYFAKAARAGSEAGSVVELARMEDAKWVTWVDLSGLEAGLRRQAAKAAGSLHRDFKATFGALSDVWGSPEARAYVDGLRRRN